MTAESFIALYQTDPRAACRQARALGNNAVHLALALAARYTTPPLDQYTYWLRTFQCPPLPAGLRARGWAWLGDALHNDALRVTVHRTGDAAIAQAEVITAALMPAVAQQEVLL